ncbi:MAG: c-type cytochrome [Bryobacterales bacterium]|nr:c-type cytochrome [Bryobacterales bacterium]
MSRVLLVAWFLVAAPLVAQLTPAQTAKGLKTAPGLETTLWAAEPMMSNPTSLDIDERGRVWYIDSVNYRRKLKKLPDLRKTGDRIVILEDTNGDGKADRKKIFYESPDLRTPMGIAVLGNRVYVSQSPDLILFTKDENDNVVNREVLLTGWRGVEHDHGLHSVALGPDGRLYFNSGDLGFDVTDKSGKRWVSSKQGPYYAGAAFRMNLDGSDFTVIGHNFRNPYELAVDSFGGVWQSDNDDDGNAWTRFNYVLPFGNFGYWGPGGKGWREDRGTHFHEENPGVVPTVARLGAGSPTGLLIYEGNLLPPQYRGQPIHTEAGKRVVNSYAIESAGAGYKLTVNPLITGEDPWFRPTDASVHPDGSVFVADWYDPTVGGHNIGDPNRGRVYRLAPPGHKVSPVQLDLSSPEGLLKALASPNQATRFAAFSKLKAMGEAATPILRRAWEQKDDPILRARALWLIPGSLPDAYHDDDARFRLLAVRVAAAWNRLPEAYVLRDDRSPAVRRELAALLHGVAEWESGPVLTDLARKWTGEDRWYLEALGIGMQGGMQGIESQMWARLRKALLADDPRLFKLAWRLRVPESLPFLVSAMKAGNRLALEAVAAQPSEDAAKAVAELAAADGSPMPLRAAALEQFGARVFSEWAPFRGLIVPAAAKALTTPQLMKPAVRLAEDLEDPAFAPALAQVVTSAGLDSETRVAAIAALGRTKSAEGAKVLQLLVGKGELVHRVAAVRALGSAQAPAIEARMQQLILSKEPNELRSEALRMLLRTPSGATAVLDLEQKQELPAELRNVAANLLSQSRDAAVKTRAAKLLPPAATRRGGALNARSVVARQGDAMSGRKVFFKKEGANCGLCHAVEGTETKVGPSLSSIGDKLGKDAMLDAILNPSAGIAHEFQTWFFETKSQGQVIGVIAQENAQRVTVKNELGEATWIKPADIRDRRKSNLSIMPEDLIGKMTEQEVVDLLEFLSTLKESKKR